LSTAVGYTQKYDFHLTDPFWQTFIIFIALSYLNLGIFSGKNQLEKLWIEIGPATSINSIDQHTSIPAYQVSESGRLFS